MLEERLLTRVMRHEYGQQLVLADFEKPRIPGPTPGTEYLLYAHVPFCERLCPYCSFNRYPFHEDRARSYFRALREEMRMVADQGYDFQSMYVGGGTPTVLVDELCATLDLARELFSIKEVSSETNPNHLLPEYAEELAPRIQRLSVGVQSFDDSLLKQMDRYDKYGSGALTLERIQQMQGVFHSMNVDMIFNFPSQTEAMLRRDLEILKESGCNQTTFYPLMASPVVEKSLAATVGKVDYARERDYYAIISEQLADTFEPGSAWTFSRIAGGMIDEYIVDYEQYVGIGSGAFSFLRGAIYAETFSLRDYEAAIAAGMNGVNQFRQFDAKQQMRYRFLMELFGLRMDKVKFERDFGVAPEKGIPMEMAYMRAVGAFATNDAEEATLTPKGRYLLVAMMREFFIGVNGFRDVARNALTTEERTLLFGEGTCAAEDSHPLGQVAADTETAEDVPVPPVGR